MIPLMCPIYKTFSHESCQASLMGSFQTRPGSPYTDSAQSYYNSQLYLLLAHRPVHEAVEDNQQDEGDEAVDEEVEVDEIELDVVRVETQLGGVNLEVLHHVHLLLRQVLRGHIRGVEDAERLISKTGRGLHKMLSVTWCFIKLLMKFSIHLHQKT